MASQGLTEESILKAVRDAVRERIEEVAAEELKAATDRINRKIPQIVASVSLALFSTMNLERHGTDVLLKVKFDGWQK